MFWEEFDREKHQKKFWKNLLTNDPKCGIINKFAAKPDGSRRAGQRARKITESGRVREKKDLKKSEKPLDKQFEMWYNKMAYNLIERYRKWAGATVKKKLQKTLKKGLTKSRKCGIINKSPDENKTSKERRKLHLENWTMREKKRQEKLEPLVNSDCKICIVLWEVRQDYKTQTVIASDSQWTRFQNQIKLIWRYNSMKSLILAQDERWRHA